MRAKAQPALGVRAAGALLALALLLTRAAAALEPAQVLVVYNHYDPDSLAVRDHYRRLRPGALDFDLADKRLIGHPTIAYGQFRDLIRQPMRKFFLANPGLAERIICLAIAKGLPHRIDDIRHPGCGDDAEAMRRQWLERGDFTAASVDSELTLLWQDLERREGGGRFDCKADGFIVNPYRESSRPIAEFSRAAIMQPKIFSDVAEVGDPPRVWQAGWMAASAPVEAQRLTPGDIYLVARLDGPTLADALAALDRAQNLVVDPAEVAIVLDGNEARDLDKGDYERAAARLREAGWEATLDKTSEFILPGRLARPLIAYASYGLNDDARGRPASPDYIRGFRFAPGAIFNTLESFNGRDFGGLGDRPGREQTQLADFIRAGGTFGIGNVWEPFTFSAAGNEPLLDGFLNRGMTFVESAYRSLLALSWQQIVVGDPLATLRRAPKAAAAASVTPAP